MWWLKAFLVTFILDALIVFYTRRSCQGKPWQAGAFSVSITVLSGLVTLWYVERGAETIIPVALGAFVGTTGAVWWDTRK
jgi:hypothetical protein